MVIFPMLKLTKCLILILFIFNSVLYGDLLIGVGTNVDVPGGTEETTPILSLKYEFNDWFALVNTRNSYTMYGSEIEKHFIFAAGYQVYKLDFTDDIYFYVDIGLSAASKLSIASSSKVMFYEGFGLAFNDFRLSISHTSNGGLAPPNEGETAFMVEYSFKF